MGKPKPLAIPVQLDDIPEELREALGPDVDALFYVPVDRVHPNTWNPNVVPETTMLALKANIERVGFNLPVLLRPHPVDAEGNLCSDQGASGAANDWQIVDGEHRWLTMKALGRTYVLAIVRDLSDAEAKGQTLAMNRLRGDMDPADVARVSKEMSEQGLDLSEQATFVGYSEEELAAQQKLLEFDWSSLGEAPSDDQTPPDPGDRWVDLKWSVPASVADIVNAELDRLLMFLGHEGKHDTHTHLAVELMAVTSAQTPEEHIGGDA